MAPRRQHCALVDVHHAHIAHAVVVRQSLKHCFATFHAAPFVKQTLQLFSPFRIYEHTPIHMHACVLSQQSDLQNPVSCVLALFQHTLKLIMDHKKTTSAQAAVKTSTREKLLAQEPEQNLLACAVLCFEIKGHATAALINALLGFNRSTVHKQACCDIVWSLAVSD